MPVDDIIQIRIECLNVDQTSENLRHYRVSATTPPEATLTQIATQLDTALHTLYKSILTSAASYRGVGARRIHPLPLSLEAQVNANAGNGTIGGDPLPSQTAGIITWRTAFSGRGFRGRTYLPFPAESDNVGGAIPSGGWQNGAGLIANALFLTLVVPNLAGSSTLVPVIFHRRTRTNTTIQSFVVRPRWATQRRRGDYGRPNIPTM